jgi:hypothetical protein
MTGLPDGTLLAEAVAADPVAWLGAESWIVLEAEPDAAVYLGFSRDVGADELTGWTRSQDVEAMLAATNRVPVAAGDSVLCPAGTVHAISAGIQVIELQEPADLSDSLPPCRRPGDDEEPDDPGRAGEKSRAQDQVDVFLRAAVIRPANIRSHTRIGSTSARGPNRSATTCRTKLATFAPIPASHSGCLIRSSSSSGDSARRRWTRLVASCSVTAVIAYGSEEPRAATTAISGNNDPSVGSARLA